MATAAQAAQARDEAESQAEALYTAAVAYVAAQAVLGGSDDDDGASLVLVAAVALALALILSLSRRSGSSFVTSDITTDPDEYATEFGDDLAARAIKDSEAHLSTIRRRETANNPAVTETEVVDKFKNDTAWVKAAARTTATEAAAQSAIDMMPLIDDVTGEKHHLMWLSRGDHRVRRTHRHLHGDVKPFGKAFKMFPDGRKLRFPGDPLAPLNETINCLPAGSPVDWFGSVERVYRRDYHGVIVKLTTAEGDQLSVTPNHPILTLTGWVAAKDIQQGDQVLRARPVRTPDVDHCVTPTVEQVFAAAQVVADAGRMSGRAVDFHGDGSDEEVDVVSVDGDLRAVLHTQLGQPIAEYELVGLPSGLSDFPGGSALASACQVSVAPFAFRRDAVAAAARMSRPRELATGFSRERPQFVGLPDPSYWQPQATEIGVDDHASGGKPIGPNQSVRDRGDWKPLVVEPTEIVVVEQDVVSTHVFNLQVSSGVLLTESIIHSNCRCVLFLVPASSARSAKDVFKVQDPEWDIIDDLGDSLAASVGWVRDEADRLRASQDLHQERTL